MKNFKYIFKDIFPPVLAAFIATFISYAGPLLIVMQAAQVAHWSPTQLTSWIGGLLVGAGVCSMGMSWRYRMPILCAWNTPGAALLATALVTVSPAEAVGAYMVCGLAMVLVGISGVFERLMHHIPKSLCAAMLAGILLRFGVDAFGAARHEATGSGWLVALMFVAYLGVKRHSPRYAVVASLLMGVALWQIGGMASPPANATIQPLQWSWTTPLWITPEFTLSSMVSIGLPLFIVSLTGQQLPGIAVLRAAGYAAPTSPLIAGTGWASVLIAPLGAHGVNLAAITAAICTGEEAHPQPEKRWIGGVASGVFYAVSGCFAGVLTGAFLYLPSALVATVAGLALLGAIQSGLTNAVNQPEEAEAALVTFIVTSSNISLLGLGSACWGLGLGLLAYGVLRPSTPPNPAH